MKVEVLKSSNDAFWIKKSIEDFLKSNPNIIILKMCQMESSGALYTTIIYKEVTRQDKINSIINE